jgi:hypothetical protein
MGMGDTFTGGEQGDAIDAAQKGLDAYGQIQAPTLDQLSLPELQQYVNAGLMTPAQMQAYLQQNNALNAPINQSGTAAQIAAINQLAGVANAGAEGSATQRAQIEQVNQDAARNLAGQRGAIDQQAQARGVAPGMLQAALGQVQAGQGQQDAHMAALQAQGQNYQQALAAMASGASAGSALQGQQNTQANTVAQAQNAMQQFNAANQQNASQNNAANRQASNAYNATNAQAIGSANTGLANQRTEYNATVPQTVYNNALNKAAGVTNAGSVAAGQAQAAGQQNAGLAAGLLGTAGGVIGGIYGGPVGAAAGSKVGQYAGTQMGDTQNAAYGKVIEPYAQGGMVGHEQCLHEGGLCLKGGGMVPGHARVPGNSPVNDTVRARVSPGEAVIPRTAVQQNPALVGHLLGHGSQPPMQPPLAHHPQDVATLLAAMKHLRGV